MPHTPNHPQPPKGGYVCNGQRRSVFNRKERKEIMKSTVGSQLSTVPHKSLCALCALCGYVIPLQGVGGHFLISNSNLPTWLPSMKKSAR